MKFPVFVVAVLLLSVLVGKLFNQTARTAATTNWTGTEEIAPKANAQRVIRATPRNYLKLLRTLQPGDSLVLQPGVYNDPSDSPGLPLFDLSGTAEKPIVIGGEDPDHRPVLIGRAGANTVRIKNASYLVIRNLELDGRSIPDVDGVKAQGVSHHITIENLLIRNHDADQSVVGISTKYPAWDWVIRNNTIIGAGTGMYLGNPDGSAPFVRGLIEGNVILDSIGYNIEIKHQVIRESVEGMPTSDSRTVVRNNVFSKGNSSSFDKPRPNLLVGHFPPTGPGANDVYEIYGNFFYNNPTGEPLFQGEGNIALYNNVMFNDMGDAIWIQPHNAVPRSVSIFHNTIVAVRNGIRVRGGDPRFRQRVFANVVFAGRPVLGGEAVANSTGTYKNASSYVTSASAEMGKLDLFPKAKLAIQNVDASWFRMFEDSELDFNGTPRSSRQPGAYDGFGSNPGWKLALDFKKQDTRHAEGK